MSAEHLACRACGKIFSDRAPFAQCDPEQGGCGASYCSETCAQLKPSPEARAETGRPSCASCRGDLEDDASLLSFLLKQVGKCREQLLREFRQARNAKKHACGNFIYLNDGSRAEYLPGLKSGDKLRSRQKIWSQGCSGDLVYGYAAFEVGQPCEVDHMHDWDGHAVGFVRDSDNTCWLALADRFERVQP